MSGESEEVVKEEGSWDKERQFKDELASEREKKAKVEGQLEAQNRELEHLRANKAKVEEASENLDDYEGLKTAFVETRNKLKSVEDELGQSRNTISNLTSQSQQQEGMRVFREEMDKLEGVYGKEYSNEVISEVSEAVGRPAVQNMSPEVKAEHVKTLLENSFMKKAQNAKPNNKPDTPESAPDTGTGGAATISDDIKPGSVEEVSKQMAARDRKSGT